MNLTLLKTLFNLEFCFAIFKAFLEMSIAIPFDSLNSRNKEVIIQPDPVPTSRINSFFPL